MGRWRSRIRLEDGLNLSLPKLMRDGMVKPGMRCAGPLRWRNTGTGEEVASVWFTADFTGPQSGFIRLEAKQLDQTIVLTSQPRNLGAPCGRFHVSGDKPR